VSGVGLAVEGHQHLSHLTEQSVGSVVRRGIEASKQSKGGEARRDSTKWQSLFKCVCMAGVGVPQTCFQHPCGHTKRDYRSLGLGRAAETPETPVSSNR